MRWRAIPLLFAACMSAAGCNDIFRESYDYGTVVVRATDGEGGGVPAVRLTLYTSTTHMEYGVTGPDGTHTFRFVPAGGYGIEAGPPEGYRWPEGALPYQYVDVEKGGRDDVDFSFEALD